MSAAIGLYIGRDRLACVVIATHRIVWHAQHTRAADSLLEAELDHLLHGIRFTRFERPTLYASLGPTLAQVKLLRGVPPVDSPRVVRQLIEQSPSRFFLATDTLPVVAEPVRGVEGWWVAVADAGVVGAVDALCDRRGWRRGGTRPVATVLDRALADKGKGSRVRWSDGDCIDVTYGDHGIVAIARVAGEEPAIPLPLDPPLEQIGSDALRFAAAYGAAKARTSAPFALRLRREGVASASHVARRAASIAAVIIGVVVMLGAPGIVAARVRQHNEREIETLRVATPGAAKERMAAEQMNAAIAQVRAFAASRRLLTPLLSSLSMQLPESSAIVALRLDTLGGTIVTLSPLGAEIVPAVGSMSGVEGLQLSAPITREVVGPLEFQRIAVRFHFRRDRGVHDSR